MNGGTDCYNVVLTSRADDSFSDSPRVFFFFRFGLS